MSAVILRILSAGAVYALINLGYANNVNEAFRLKNDKIVVSQEAYNALLLHVKKMVVIAGTQVKQPLEFGFVNELQHETAVRRVEHRAA